MEKDHNHKHQQPQGLDERIQQQAEQVEQQGKKLIELSERVEQQEDLVQQQKEKVANLLKDSE